MVSENEEQKNLRQIGVFITIPFVLAVPPILGWLIGSWLDRFFGVEPYLMYIFLVLGFIAGFREMYRIVRRYGNGA
jgi:ATP synthase protein I